MALPFGYMAAFLRKGTLQATKQSRCFSANAIPPNKQKWIPTSGSYPKGFRVGATHVGMKPTSKSQPDLVLVSSDTPACGAAVFTRNEFPAASVTVSKAILHSTKGYGIRGVIANSSCANLLTGQPGLDDATIMSNEAAKLVSRPGESQPSSVMVMHTGHAVIRLPMEKIRASMPELHANAGNSHEQWLQAAAGICTGDTFPKLVSRTFNLPSSPGTTFTIAGITKGAGMIHPNMATTLGIICTDAPVTPAALQRLLSTSAGKSYNCISVDGDTSTNDMVAMLANGAAGGPTVDIPSAATSTSDDFHVMQRILDRFMADMAQLVVRDGDGASKFITIRVRGSPSHAAAKHIASAISRSMLLKTAVYGKHPVWKDVVSTLGYSLLDTKFDGQGIIKRDTTSVSFVAPDGTGELKFLDRGHPAPVDENKARWIMDQEDVEVVLDLRDEGNAKSPSTDEAVFWTCDLTHEFVSINMA